MGVTYLGPEHLEGTVGTRKLGREYVDGSVGTGILGRERGDGSMGIGVWCQKQLNNTSYWCPVFDSCGDFAIVLGLFVTAVVILANLGGEFIPELNEGDFAVETLLHSNASLSQSIKMNTRAQQIILREFPDEVSQVVSRIGASEIPTDPMGINSCDLIIELKDMKHWKKAKTIGKR